jgi:predicted MFS family arabinose efflux permease
MVWVLCVEIAVIRGTENPLGRKTIAFAVAQLGAVAGGLVGSASGMRAPFFVGAPVIGLAGACTVPIAARGFRTASSYAA